MVDGAHSVGWVQIATAVLPLAAFLWPIWQFVAVRRADYRNREFELYHRLIRDLVQPEGPDGVMRLDRQIAIVFELRHFRRYRPVSARILGGLKAAWVGDDNKRLIQEIDLTLEHFGERARLK